MDVRRQLQELCVQLGLFDVTEYRIIEGERYVPLCPCFSYFEARLPRIVAQMADQITTLRSGSGGLAIGVFLKGERIGYGDGGSYNAAKRTAARKALRWLQNHRSQQPQPQQRCSKEETAEPDNSDTIVAKMDLKEEESEPATAAADRSFADSEETDATANETDLVNGDDGDGLLEDPAKLHHQPAAVVATVATQHNEGTMLVAEPECEFVAEQPAVEEQHDKGQLLHVATAGDAMEKAGSDSGGDGMMAGPARSFGQQRRSLSHEMWLTGGVMEPCKPVTSNDYFRSGGGGGLPAEAAAPRPSCSRTASFIETQSAVSSDASITASSITAELEQAAGNASNPLG